MQTNVKVLNSMTQEQWLTWRRSGIGSTDACVIKGVSPWRTPHQLWQEKVYGDSVQVETPAMRRGKEKEAEARSWLEKELNVTLFPMNVERTDVAWLKSSLDCLDLDGQILGEIKWPNREDHAVAVNKMIPEKYIPQVQHQLEVIGLDEGVYVSCFENEKVIVDVKRNKSYIDAMMEEEQKFWDMVLKKEAPALTDRDFINLEKDKVWQLMESQWLDIKATLDMAESQDKELRDLMIAHANHRNALGASVKISKSLCQGTIDYKAIMADYPEIDWESYRKKSFEKWTFRATG